MSQAPSSAIVIIDTRDPMGAVRSVQSTLTTLQGQAPEVRTVYWVSDQPCPVTLSVPTRHLPIPTIQRFPQDYNWATLVLVPHWVEETWTFVVQADGFAVNPGAWTQEFLDYDYIGATWPWEDVKVGNGGFSLRSHRLHQALKSMRVPHDEYPEDFLICRQFSQRLESEHGIRFAPAELADQFSIEWNMSSPWLGRSLGFHGPHGVAQHYGVAL